MQEPRVLIHSTHHVTSEENDNRTDTGMDFCRKTRVDIGSSREQRTCGRTSSLTVSVDDAENFSTETPESPSLLRVIGHSIELLESEFYW